MDGTTDKGMHFVTHGERAKKTKKYTGWGKGRPPAKSISVPALGERGTQKKITPIRRNSSEKNELEHIEYRIMAGTNLILCLTL